MSWCHELSGAAACTSKLPLEVAFKIENRNAIVRVLDNLNLVAVDIDATRPIELAIFAALTSEHELQKGWLLGYRYIADKRKQTNSDQ